MLREPLIPIAVVLSSSGCIRSADVELAPQAAEAAAAVLIAIAPGEAPIVWTVDVEGGRAHSRPISLSLGDTYELYMLLYGCEANAMNLAPDSLQVIETEEGKGTKLFEPFASYRSSLTGGAQQPWTTVDPSARPPALEAFARGEIRLHTSGANMGSSITPCTKMIPSMSDPLVGAALALEGDEALVGVPFGPRLDRRSAFFSIATATSATDSCLRSASIPNATPSLGGFRTDGGELWLSGTNGDVVRGTIGRFTSGGHLAIAAGEEYGVMSIDGDDGGAELFAVTDDGRVHRRPPTAGTSTRTWEAPFGPGSATLFSFVSIAYAGRGRAFVAAPSNMPGEGGFFRVDASNACIRRESDASRSGLASEIVTAVARRRNGGIVAGTCEGALYEGSPVVPMFCDPLREPDTIEWTRIEPPMEACEEGFESDTVNVCGGGGCAVTAIAEATGTITGLIAGYDSGKVFFHPDGGDFTDRTPEAQDLGASMLRATVRRIVPLAGSAVIVAQGTNHDTGAATEIYVSVVDVSATCSIKP